MVKKCPDPACGFEGEGAFCSECGKKMIDKSEIIVICAGKTGNGQVCGAPLTAKNRFCTNCGSKVLVLDPGLVEVKGEEIVCTKCGTKSEPDEKFCRDCGHELVKVATKGI